MYLKKEQALSVVIVGTIQFLILSTIAMLFYTGGTRIDETAQGYGFFTNFFSDLGRTTAYSGEGNLISTILFVTTLVGLGLTFLIFFQLIPEIFDRTDEEQKLSNYVSILGTISAFAFIGVALTPANIIPIIHDALVILGFSLTTLVLGILLILTLKDPVFPKFYIVIYSTLIIIILAYGGLFFLIPKIVTLEDLIWRVTMQKIVVYNLLYCFLNQSYGIWRHRIKNEN